MRTNDDKSKAARSPFFLFKGVFTLAVGIFAFWPFIVDYATYPSLVQLHALIMLGWLLIFLGQVYFAWNRQISTHIKLGKAAMYFTIPIAVIGLAIGYHKVARVAKAGGRVDSARIHFIGSFIHFIQFAIFFFSGYFTRSKKELHRTFMVYANAALLPPAGGRLIVNWGWAPPIAFATLPFATLILHFIYEIFKGNAKSVLLSLVCFAFVVAGIVYELVGSNQAWFVAFTDFALGLDLMPWLGDTSYGNINEAHPLDEM